MRKLAGTRSTNKKNNIKVRSITGFTYDFNNERICKKDQLLSKWKEQKESF